MTLLIEFILKDPGSPLVVNGELNGLMSWGIGCGRPRLPSVYTRLSTARFWIEWVMSLHA